MDENALKQIRFSFINYNSSVRIIEKDNIVTRLLISTALRHSFENQPSGRLLVFDVELNKVVQGCEIIEPPFRKYDPNPRGGFRGLNGIVIENNLIAIANASTIFLYDKLWTPLGCFWHPSCTGIHDLCFNEDKIWVTSTNNDLLFCFDLNGNLIKHIDVRSLILVKDITNNQVKPFLSKEEILSGKVNFRDPRSYDHIISDALHVNSFVVLDDGDYLISCGLLRIVDRLALHKLNHWMKQTPLSTLYAKMYKFQRKILKKDRKDRLEKTDTLKKNTLSIILRVKQDNSCVNALVIDDCFVPGHSLRLLNNSETIYLNSSTGELIIFDPTDFSIKTKNKIGENFLRGARKINDQTLMLGDNNYLIHYDLRNKEVISRTLLSKNPNEAVFDIQILPEGYSLPPESFVEHHTSYLPVEQEKIFSQK